MKKIKHIKEEIEVEVLEDIICDKCGCSHKDNYIESFEISWGYGSDFDCEIWKFDLCQKCIVDLLKDVQVQKIDTLYGVEDGES